MCQRVGTLAAASGSASEGKTSASASPTDVRWAHIIRITINDLPHREERDEKSRHLRVNLISFMNFRQNPRLTQGFSANLQNFSAMNHSTPPAAVPLPDRAPFVWSTGVSPVDCGSAQSDMKSNTNVKLPEA
jgi:hypothetical protein